VALGHREALSARMVIIIRLLFAVLGLASMVLGYIGLGRYTHAEILQGTRPAGDDSAGNLVYYDIELFLVQSTPLSVGGPVPWELQIARFSAPCVALYTIAEIGVALFATRVQRVRLRRARGHVVVYGSTRAARVLATRLRSTGKRVIVAESAPPVVDRIGRDAQPGDPDLPRTLTDSGAHRAAQLYACLDLGEQNARIADAAERLRRRSGHPRKIQVLIPDLDLCMALRARRWSLAQTDARHTGFFNPDEIAGLATVRSDRAAFEQHSPEIAIAGTGAFARSVLVEFARQWATYGSSREQTLGVVLIGQDAQATATALLGRYAFLADVCRIQARTEPLEMVLAQRRDDPSVRRLVRLYLCQEDENEALTAALDQAAHLQSTFAEVVVRLDRMAGIASAFRAEHGADGLVDALGGRLRLVDVADISCDPELIEEDLAEWLARAYHQRHLTERLRAGAEPGSSPALTRWEELGEDYRAANRDQAMDIGRKLAAIGCLISPRRAGGPPFEYHADEVERLAELEHERWAADRRRHGWSRGRSYDAATKQHPDLVPWAMLSEQRREPNFRAVRDIPPMLADAGLAIIRGRPPASGRWPVRDPGPGPSISPAAILPARSP